MEKEISEIKNKKIEWGLGRGSSLRRGYIVELFEERDIFEEFKANHWAFGNTPAGQGKRRGYLRLKERYEGHLEGDDPDSEDDIDDDESEQRFAAESDLRDFLANNPARIEQGLKVHQDGVEYAIDGGFIDILATDRNGKFVVIELKVARGRNKTVGQLLYYMAWIDRKMGNGPCRGIIIAKEISDDLALAVSRAPGVELYRYNLSVSVEPVARAEETS